MYLCVLCVQSMAVSANDVKIVLEDTERRHKDTTDLRYVHVYMLTLVIRLVNMYVLVFRCMYMYMYIHMYALHVAC